MSIKKTILSLLAVASVLISAPLSALAVQEQQPEAPQRMRVQDPIRELNLSPEQREKIRAIREQLRDERAAINQRLRETNWALDTALDADNPDEALLEQLMRDVAAAQAANMRMRILSEVKIRRVLTAEQLVTLRQLRRTARELRRERQLDNLDGRRREGVERQRGLYNRRQNLGPFLPRPVDPQRRPRP